MLNVLYIIGGIVGLLWLATCGYLAYRNRESKSKMWMWIGLSGIGLLPLLASILHPGTGKAEVVIVKPLGRTVAPPPQEQADADAKAEVLKQQAEALRLKNEELDQKADKLDEQWTELEEKSENTDQRIKEATHAESTVPTTPSARKPNPHTSGRLNNGG